MAVKLSRFSLLIKELYETTYKPKYDIGLVIKIM